MHKVLGVLVLGLLVAGLFIGSSGHAKAVEPIVQEVVITASVEHARYIIVNDEGVMTKIYSNTDQPVEPQVRLNTVNGAVRPLSDSLRNQYEQIVTERSTMVGAEITVPALQLANKVTTPTQPVQRSQAQPDIKKFIDNLSPELLKFH